MRGQRSANQARVSSGMWNSLMRDLGGESRCRHCGGRRDGIFWHHEEHEEHKGYKVGPGCFSILIQSLRALRVLCGSIFSTRFFQNRNDAGFFEIEGGHLDLDFGAGLKLGAKRESGFGEMAEGDFTIAEGKVDSAFVALLGNGGGGSDGLGGHAVGF